MSTNSLPTREQSSASLHNYISAKFPQFTERDAAAVVDAVHSVPSESTKALAQRLRGELAKRGVTVKHTVALQAATRVQSLSDWYTARSTSVAHLELEVVGFGNAASVVRGGWRAAIAPVIAACDSWLRSHPTARVITLDVRPRYVAFAGVHDGEKIQHPTLGPSTEPIAIVRPVNGATAWLDDARAAVETLRRRIEPTHRAILDGYALVSFCTGDGAFDLLGHTAVGIADAPNAELVLISEDNPLDVGYEVMRGNEVACWFQLDLDIERTPAVIGVNEEDGAWQCGSSRFVWEISALHADESPPGLSRRNLTVAESHKLLRRYMLAKRVFATGLPGRHAPKNIEALGGPPETCRIDVHRVARAFAEAGQDWQSYLVERDEEGAGKGVVTMGFFLGLAEHLSVDNPNTLLARPPRGELVRAADDTILRALIPRVHHVRYRSPPGLDSERKTTLTKAIETFSASLALRKGVFPMEEQLPQAVYSGDADDLRATLEQIGLVMHVGVLPHLTLIPAELRASLMSGMCRFAFGYALYLDVDFEAVAA